MSYVQVTLPTMGTEDLDENQYLTLAAKAMQLGGVDVREHYKRRTLHAGPDAGKMVLECEFIFLKEASGYQFLQWAIDFTKSKLYAVTLSKHSLRDWAQYP